MAHFQWYVTDDYKPKQTYNTDFPVGPSGFNRTDDVMLVQKMLRYLYVDQSAYMVERLNAPVPDGIGEMALDGTWSPVLGRAIVAFKLTARRRGVMLYPDAIVLPCGPDARVKSRVTGATYTITVMGSYCLQADQDSAANPYVTALSGWPYDEENPKELRDALKLCREQALGWKSTT